MSPGSRDFYLRLRSSAAPLKAGGTEGVPSSRGHLARAVPASGHCWPWRGITDHSRCAIREAACGDVLRC